MPKAPNYTEAQTDMMKARYIEVSSESQARRDEVVAEIAAELGKSVRSVRSKLSRENVYVAKKPTSKDGTPAVRKETLVNYFSTLVGLPMESAINMTKNDLKKACICIRDLRQELEDRDKEDA